MWSLGCLCNDSWRREGLQLCCAIVPKGDAECSPSGDRVFLEDKNYSDSPSGKSVPKKLLPDSPPCINQFQSLRDLLKNCPSSDSSSSYPASVITEYAFDDVVSVELLRCANEKDWILPGRRK